jgi:hypothetical protein
MNVSERIEMMLKGAELTPMQLATGWIRLPGQRMEFRDSGFVIQLRTDPRCQPFLLLDPDGRPISEHYVLQPLKMLAEQMARDRGEFI